MYQLLKLIGTGSGGLIHLSEVNKMSIDSGNFFPPSDLATWVYVDVIYKYRSESFLFKICVQFRNIFPGNSRSDFISSHRQTHSC